MPRRSVGIEEPVHIRRRGMTCIGNRPLCHWDEGESPEAQHLMADLDRRTGGSIGTEPRTHLRRAPCPHSSGVGIQLPHNEQVQLAIGGFQDMGEEDLVEKAVELATERQIVNGARPQPRILSHASAQVHGWALAVLRQQGKSGLTGLPHQYYQVGPECLLPLDGLYERGFLGHDTLWIVATPPAWHVPYLVQLAGRCRTAVEKPLAATSRQARLLRPFTEGCQVYCLNHKVFNAAVLAFVETCRRDPAILRQVRHIEGVFYETAGISHGRQQEDGIIDVQWHLFTTALIAPFKAAASQSSFDVTVDKVQVATHAPDPHGRYGSPTVWTASQIQGRLLWDGHEVTYDHRQVKGAPRNAKEIRLFDSAGTLLHMLDLNETGSQAHTRMLQTLLRPVVDMRLTLADAIAVMDLIDLRRAMAHEAPPYAFGHFPDFLAEGTTPERVLPRAA